MKVTVKSRDAPDARSVMNLVISKSPVLPSKTTFVRVLEPVFVTRKFRVWLASPLIASNSVTPAIGGLFAGMLTALPPSVNPVNCRPLMSGRTIVRKDTGFIPPLGRLKVPAKLPTLLALKLTGNGELAPPGGIEVASVVVPEKPVPEIATLLTFKFAKPLFRIRTQRVSETVTGASNEPKKTCVAAENDPLEDVATSTDPEG